METKDAYSFPIYQRMGRALRPVIASRYWIAAVLILAFLLYLPFLSAGFFQDDYGFRIQFDTAVRERLNLPPGVLHTGELDLYNFSSDPATFKLGQEIGFTPWWASEKIKTSFFRPLASLSLAIDYTLWPDAPLVMHLHSLLWFGLLIVLAWRLYRDVSGSAIVAGVSLLLLVVDDTFAGPVGWISNRHALIAMVFGVLCVWLYHRGATGRNWRFVAGAFGAYALALLTSEMGLVTFAYLFACMLILDGDTWRARVLRIAPFVLITVVWRLVYTRLGYGAIGTLLYIDPILSPGDFITQFLGRYPLLLFSAVGLPVADVLIAFSPQALMVTAALSLIPLALLALAVYPVLKAHRAAAFWLIGLLCAAVPLVSGIPGNRNLGFVSLGVMALAGRLLVDVASMKRPAPLSRLRMILLKPVVLAILILFAVISPLLVRWTLSTNRTTSEAQAGVVDFGADPKLADQHLVVVNPPGTMVYIAGLFQRMFSGDPFPASINYLSSGFTPVTIERLDERTILVTPEAGYTPLPGTIVDPATGMATGIDLQNVYRALDENFYNPRDPMHAGQVVTLSQMTVEVTRMTDDGRIAQARFTFARPLEDDRTVWLLWNAATSTYTVVRMPEVGETRVYR